MREKFPLHRAGERVKGAILSHERMAPLEPQEKDFDWQSQARMAFVPPEGDCLRAALPRLELLYDLPLLLSSAVAQPLAALLPYGCGTPLAGAALESARKCSVITCYRWHNIAASVSNAAFGRQSAAQLPSLAPHDSKARLQNGDETHGFMAKPCTPHLHCAARAVLQD